MHRPSRQHQHLLEKISLKESRGQQQERKPGKRAKQWKKWVAQYAPLTQQGGESQGESQGENQA